MSVKIMSLLSMKFKVNRFWLEKQFFLSHFKTTISSSLVLLKKTMVTNIRNLMYVIIYLIVEIIPSLSKTSTLVTQPNVRLFKFRLFFQSSCSLPEESSFLKICWLFCLFFSTCSNAPSIFKLNW